MFPSSANLTEGALVEEASVDRFEDIPRNAKGVPMYRNYRHLVCGGVTTTVGDTYWLLCYPYYPMNQAYCATCAKSASVREFCWVDTGEVIREYRHRVLMESPSFLKNWKLGLGFVVGAAVGAGSVFPFVMNLTYEEAEPYYVAALIIGTLGIHLIGGFVLDFVYGFDPRRVR